MSILINICLFGAIFGLAALVLTEACDEDMRHYEENHEII